MRNSRMCTQGIAGYFWGDLSFSSLSLALPPYSACNPTQQLGWTGLGQSGWFSLCSPGQYLGRARRHVSPPWYWCDASSAQICACSISSLSCLVTSRSPVVKGPVRNYKPLKVGACSQRKAESYIHTEKIAIYPSFSHLFCPLWQHQLQTTGFEFIVFGLQKVTTLSV